MRLTLALSFYKRYKKVPGLLHAGKNRIIPTLTPEMKMNAVKRLIQEQDNVNVLSNPYLSREEDEGHMRDMGLREKNTQEFLEQQKAKKWRDHQYMSSHLDTLNVTKAWE